MAKKKIIVIDSEKEKQLTETLLKNIKKGKIKENETSYDIQKEVDEGVYDEEIAEAYREEKASLKKLVDEADKVDPMTQLDQKITEMLEKGYADAYTKLTEKAKDGKKDISNIVKSVSKLFNNVPSPDINKNNKADYEVSKKCDCSCNCNTSKIVFEDGAYKEIPDTIPNTIGNYEMVNHPSHYNNYEKEVIDMIESIWGTYLAAMWCEITAFKYRMRMGTKPGNSIEQDINKEGWYLNKAAELKSKIYD
jgi:hypothetical protein